MVANFWDVETCGTCRRACAASPDYGAGLIQAGAHMRELEVDKARGSKAHLHGVMLKVELESGGRLHLVLIEGLRRKSTESKPIQRGKKRGTRNSDWSPVV